MHQKAARDVAFWTPSVRLTVSTAGAHLRPGGVYINSLIKGGAADMSGRLAVCNLAIAHK